MDFKNIQQASNTKNNFIKINSQNNSSYFSENKMRENVDNIKNEHSLIINILEKIISFSLVAIFFGFPIFFTGFSLQGISFEKEIYFYFWLLIALVAWVSKSVLVGELKIKKTPLDLPIVLFWFVCGIAMFFSVDRWHSFWGYFGDPSRGFINITALAIFYYLMISNLNKKRFLAVLISLFLSNFLLSIWSLILMFGVKIIPEKISQFVPLSLFGSLTGLGVFSSVMIMVILTLLFSFTKSNLIENKILKKVVIAILFLSIILNLALIIFLYSFISWLAVLIGVSFFLIYVLAQIIRPNASFAWVPMALFIIVLSILILGNNSFAKIQLPIEVIPSAQLSWDVAKNSLKENFLIGSGPATYAYDFSLHKPESFNLNPYYNLRFSQGGGILFEIISTLGFIGAIFFILLMLTFLSVGIYMLSIEKQKNKIYSLGLFSGTLIILLSSFFGKAEGPVIMLGVLLATIAIYSLINESDAKQQEIVLSFKASPKYALALAFVFMIVSAGVVFLFIFIGKIYIADVKALSATKEKVITENGSVAKLISAVSWNKKESRYQTLLAQQLMSLANEETLKGENDRNLRLIQDYLNNSISIATQAKDIAQRDVLVREALAQIYENSGLYVTDSFSLAENTYKDALKLEPANPIYFLKIGQIKLAQASSQKSPEDAKKNVSEAEEWFQKSIDKKNNFAPAYYQISLAKEALGKIDDAIKNIQQAATLEQNNINYIFNLARMYQVRGNDDDNKIAETILKGLLAKNDKDPNIHFTLGLLYEKTKRSSEAATEYKKVLNLIDKENNELRLRIEKMISNISRGIENNAENLKLESEMKNEENEQQIPPINQVPEIVPAQ